jgi:hypothetical protein
VKYRNLQERWQSRFERAVPEGQRSMFEEFKQFSSGAFVSQKDFFYRLKQMSFSDR